MEGEILQILFYYCLPHIVVNNLPFNIRGAFFAGIPRSQGLRRIYSGSQLFHLLNLILVLVAKNSFAHETNYFTFPPCSKSFEFTHC